MRRASWLWAVLLLFTLVKPMQAATAPDLQAYRAHVHALRLQLDAVIGAGSTQSVRKAIEVRLEALARVHLPDGRVITTNLPALADTLRHDPSFSLAAVARALDALDDSLGSTAAAPPDPARLAALDSVLRDSRFHPSENLVQQFFDWVGGQIDRFLGWIGDLLQGLIPSSPSASLPTYAFALVFLIVVAGAALLIARAAIRRGTREAPALDEHDEPRTSVAARDRLDRSLAGGDYRLALRYLLLSTLLELQERGVLRLRPGLTNREYLGDLERDLARNQAVARPMAEFIEVFDRTWYGHVHIGQGEYERCLEHAREAARAASAVGAA